jgi:hypothetical protein
MCLDDWMSDMERKMKTSDVSMLDWSICCMMWNSIKLLGTGKA